MHKKDRRLPNGWLKQTVVERVCYSRELPPTVTILLNTIRHHTELVILSQ